MKTLKKQIPVIISLIILFSFSACNENSQKDSSQDKTKLEKKMNEVKSNIKEEQKKLEKELDKTVDEFDDRIAVMEDELEETGDKLDDAKENILMNLKAQRDSIEAEAKQVKNVSQENWNDFKNKVTKKSKEFKKAVKDFFDSEDNKK